MQLIQYHFFYHIIYKIEGKNLIVERNSLLGSSTTKKLHLSQFTDAVIYKEQNSYNVLIYVSVIAFYLFIGSLLKSSNTNIPFDLPFTLTLLTVSISSLLIFFYLRKFVALYCSAYGLNINFKYKRKALVDEFIEKLRQKANQAAIESSEFTLENGTHEEVLMTLYNLRLTEIIDDGNYLSLKSKHLKQPSKSKGYLN